MDFEEYLMKKHVLRAGERKLKEVSVKQYVNRLDNMRRAGIYNEEKQVDTNLEKKIQARYGDWVTYVKTIHHYLYSKQF